MSEHIPQQTNSARRILEALLFASDEPLTVKQILTVFAEAPRTAEEFHLTADDVATIINELNNEYELQERAFRIITIAGGYQYATLPHYARWIGELFKEKIRRRLSQAAVETLAIIAYKQPVAKPDIEAIRGVNVDYIISTLLERNLITIVGRAESIGRPLLYGTTEYFLHHFGIHSIADLPKLREIEELMRETELEQEKQALADETALLAEKDEFTQATVAAENLPEVIL
jgi:segregation and condensation protein B